MCSPNEAYFSRPYWQKKREGGREVGRESEEGNFPLPPPPYIAKGKVGRNRRKRYVEGRPPELRFSARQRKKCAAEAVEN